MSKLMKFENSTVEMQKIDGIWMFELYSVGMALGQVKTAKGIPYPRKDRIDENVRNAEIKPVVRNGQPFISESQVYDLMLETRTDKCKLFRKWLTNEVLPKLNHTGSYSMSKVSEKSYEYFDKTYNGEPILSTADVSYITGINRATIDWFMRTKLTINFDYYLLRKSELVKFKMENPKVSRLISSMYVITQSGFEIICKAYEIKVETPKLFIEEKKVHPTEPAKFTTPQLKEKMAVLRESAERLIHLTYLLDDAPGVIISGNTYHEFKDAIIRQAKQISCFNL